MDVLLAADPFPVTLMGSFFLVCAVFGGGVLLLQLALGLFGLDGDHDIGQTGLDHAEPVYTHAGNAGAADGGGAGAGLNLLSVRALTAGLAFFGLSGLAALRAGWPSLLALLAAVVPAVLAMVVVAYVMRSLLRLQSDGSLRMSNAVGSGATVYIPIPGAEAGPGKITLVLQNRTVECDAVTRGDALPTGTTVTVVDIRDGDVLEVVPTPNPLA
jgi:membrane protein implicated in regulation of membrane protease activity